MTDLNARVRNMLAKLAVLSEAPTQTLDPHAITSEVKPEMEAGRTWARGRPQVRPHAESRMPKGVRNWRRAEPDPEVDDLFDWFVWHLQRAETDMRVRALVNNAERRYARRIVMGEELYTQRNIFGTGLDSKERDKRICALEYAGLDCGEVAGCEEFYGPISSENVRRVRYRHQLDELGHPLPEERLLVHRKDKQRRARQLDEAGIPGRQIAERFGVHHETVARWLGRPQWRDRNKSDAA